jgi:hypothetical protein
MEGQDWEKIGPKKKRFKRLGGTKVDNCRMLVIVG